MFLNFVLSLTIKLNLGKLMENLFKTHNLLKTILLIAIIMGTASQSNGQQGKPIGSGYAPSMVSKFITKYMAKVSLSFYYMALI
jgi:hypothetical protein